MSRTFSVNWDYRCPFARNAHDHVVTALQAGAGWQVDFVPFSLSQVHVTDGEPPVWDDPSQAPDLLALEAAVVVRDRLPERFLAVHQALFAARHDEGRDIRDKDVVAGALAAGGVDEVDMVMAEVSQGWPLAAVREAHEQSVERHQVFGVPTFVVGEEAAFVRFMHRPDGDGAAARETIERVVRLLAEHPELNELKRTTVGR
ncbi:MAG: DsbA family protein [Acidimicrobiales bacterium]